MFLALQPCSVFSYQFLAGLVQARLDSANPEGQPGVVTTDRSFNPVNPPGDAAEHAFTGASASTASVVHLTQLLDTFAAQPGDMFQVCRNGFNGAQ